MIRKINVCHVVSGDLWAGAEVVCRNLLRGLRQCQDLSVSAVVLNKGRLAETLRGDGISVNVLDESRESSLQIISDLKRWIESRKINIVHSHRYKENILSFFATRRQGIYRISTQHGLPEFYRGRNSVRSMFLLRMNNHILSKKFDRVVAVSEDISRHFLEDLGFPELKVDVIRNGVEIPPVSRKQRNGNKFVIGSAGRLFPVKDYPLMVEVASEISKRFDGVCFKLTGEGPDKNRVVKMITEKGLQEFFDLEGFLPDLSGFYQGIHLYLSTSWHEGIPMSLLEAMACGIPVVATNVGGIREIVRDGVEGFLTNGRDPSEIAEKCLRLIQNQDLWRRFSHAARERIKEKFPVEKMTECYRELYHRLS